MKTSDGRIGKRESWAAGCFLTDRRLRGRNRSGKACIFRSGAFAGVTGAVRRPEAGG